MVILIFLLIFVAIFIYCSVVWLLRLDFRKRFMISFFDTVGAPVGLLSSVLAVVGYFLNNISLLVIGYSFCFLSFGILIASNALFFKYSEPSTSKLQLVSRILGIVLPSIGLILSIIFSRFLS